MRVIVSVDALAPRLSGIGRYVWELSNRLPRVMGERDVRFYRHGRWVADPLILRQDGGGRSGRRILPRPPRWMRDAMAGRIIRDSLFHGPNYFLPRGTVRSVATVHDLSVFKFPETHPAERVRLFERDFNRSVAQATHLLTDTESTRRELIEFLGCAADRVTAVPLGVAPEYKPRDASVLAPALRAYGLEPGGYGLSVCTFEPRKNLDRLLDAYGRLEMSVRTRWPLVLVGGDGWLNDSLMRKIDRACAAGWARRLGFVPELELPAIYGGARAFFFLSAYEGFGLPVLEALASGVPTLAADRTSLPEVAGGAAALVDPDDADAVLRGAEAVLTDETWRKQARARGLDVARENTWDRCIERTYGVYRRLWTD